MEYNSTRKQLKFPEYGRNVQNLVDFLRTIEAGGQEAGLC